MQRVVNAGDPAIVGQVLTQIPERVLLQLLNHDLKVELLLEDSVRTPHQPQQSVGAIVWLVELLVDPLVIQARDVLVYGGELGNNVVELLPQHAVPEYLYQGTVNVVEYDECQVAHDWVSEELAFEIVVRSEEAKEKHSVRDLVTQHALLLVDVHASLPDPLNIHRVLELGVAPVELNEENSSP